jgi:alginate O-acetyltransferase complex protein AlgJ
LKRRIAVFFAVTASILSIVPAINILSAKDRKAIAWTNPTFLYNVDFLSALSSRVLLPVGISTDPQKVIVGRNGWLFLGDEYQQTLSMDSRPATEEDVKAAQRIAEASRAWSVFFAERGVKLYRVMIAPNKGSIYPEYMPNWARPASSNGTDALFAATGTEHFIDLRPSLIEAKKQQKVALYYETDTHWNHLGGALAFRAFAREVARDAPELRWPAEDAYAVSRVDPRIGGDLARFLRIPNAFDDEEPITNAFFLPVQTAQYDYVTGKLLFKGGNPPVGPLQQPVLIRSEGALNQKKVLWLRDSFGETMSLLMAASFSDVIHMNWDTALKPDGLLARMVEEQKPDYVFFTVVERLSRDPKFFVFPPPAGAQGDASKAAHSTPSSVAVRPVSAAVAADVAAARSIVAVPQALQHLVADSGEGRYRVVGVDPYVDFGFPTPIDPAQVPYLSLTIECVDGSRSLPLQLFWLTDGMDYFNEQNSMRMGFETGSRVFDLRTMPGLARGAKIRRVRIDTDAGSVCTRYRLQAPAVGKEGS